MKTAIVTGAGGFIGGALTEELLRRGYKVYGVDIRPLEREDSRFIPICADLLRDDLTELIPERADIVFNLALLGTMKGPDLNDTDLQINNIAAAVRFFKQVAPICGRFIFISSSYEFMRSEEQPDLSLCIYGIAKRAAAEMCASMAYRGHIGFVKVILTNTFGPGDRSDKAVNTLVRSMLDRKPLRLVEGKRENDWVFIDDTVNGLVAAAEKGSDFKDYYIGHREITTFREKITAMRDTLCPAMELPFGTMPENTYVDYSAIDLDALYRDTGFECAADFKESIMRTADWLKTETTPKKSHRGGVLSNLILPVRAARKAVAA